MVDEIVQRSIKPVTLRTYDVEGSEAAEKYSQDGYLGVRGVLPPDVLEAVRADAAKLFERPVKDVVLTDRPVIWCWRHKPDGKRSIFPLADSEVIQSLATGRRLHDMCRALAGTDYLQLFECVVFNKPAEIGEQFTWHNDQSYYPTEPGASISIWIALDPCDEENGALCFAKGSHRHSDVASVDVKTGKAMSGALGELPDPEKAGYDTELLLMSPGDGAFFDAHVWHASPPNRSPTRQRRGICFRFWTQPARYTLGPGKQAMFVRQVDAAPGEFIGGPCFPVFTYRAK